MRKIIPGAVILSLVLGCAQPIMAGGYKVFEIRQGTHEDAVREKYGEPLISRRLQKYFLPIAYKKVLYEIGEAIYVILDYYSGRVKSIIILEDTTLDEAKSIFNE